MSDADGGGIYCVSSGKMTAIEGAEVEVTVRDTGVGERTADKILMGLKQDVGVLAAAFDAETPPDDLDEVPAEYVPLMVVNWEGYFSDGGSEEGSA